MDFEQIQRLDDGAGHEGEGAEQPPKDRTPEERAGQEETSGAKKERSKQPKGRASAKDDFPVFGDTQLQQIEALCNQFIREARKVHLRVFDTHGMQSSLSHALGGMDLTNQDENPRIEASREDASPAFDHKSYSLAEQLEKVTTEPCFRGKLPRLVNLDSAGGELNAPIRVVEIEGVDVNACGGTHLGNICELQLLKLLWVGRDRGHIRLKYTTGDRALKLFHRSLSLSSAIGKLLACDPTAQEARVSALLQERKEAAKERKGLYEELAFALGNQLAEAMIQGDESAQVKVMQWHRCGVDVQFLNTIANAILERCPECVVLLSSDDIFLLAGNPPGLLDTVKKPVLELIGGRGGGKAGRVQGKAAALEKKEGAVRLIQELLSDDTQ